MNEKVLQDLYNRAVSLRYKGGLEDFRTLIQTNQQVQDDNYAYVQSQGYKGAKEDFLRLLGMGQTTSTIPLKKKESAPNMGSSLADGSLEPSMPETTKRTLNQVGIGVRKLPDARSFSQMPPPMQVEEAFNLIQGRGYKGTKEEFIAEYGIEIPQTQDEIYLKKDIFNLNIQNAFNAAARYDPTKAEKPVPAKLEPTMQEKAKQQFEEQFPKRLEAIKRSLKEVEKTGEYLKTVKESERQSELDRMKANQQDEEFMRLVSGIDNLTIKMSEEQAVPELNERFKKYGIVFSEAVGGRNVLLARTADGKSSVEIPLTAFGSESVLGERAKKLRDFIISNSKKADETMTEDYITKSARAQTMRRVGRLNADGSVSTVKFMSFEEDGKFKVAPTLFPKDPLNYGSRTSDWLELSPNDAIEEARRRGEIFEFKTKAEAEKFANGGWKEVTKSDIEGHKFFKDRGLDYFDYKTQRDELLAIDKEAAFISEVSNAIKEGKVNNAKQYYMKYASPEEAIKYMYLLSGNNLRPDIESYQEKRQDQKNELFAQVEDRTFFSDGKVQTAFEDFDLHLNNRAKVVSAEATELKKQVKTKYQELDAVSMEAFGVPVLDLYSYKPKNQAEVAALNDIRGRLAGLSELNKIAAEKYYSAQTYFDSKVNKAIQNEFEENMAGFWGEVNSAYENGRAGYELMKYALGASTVEEASEMISDAISNSESSSKSRAFQAFMSAGTLFLGDERAQRAFWSDPFEVTLSLIATSMSQLLPIGLRVLPTTIGTGAAVGAGVGSSTASFLGPFAIGPTAGGALQGVKHGYQVGMAIVNFAAEYSQSVLDAARESGYNISDGNSMAEALNDPEVWRKGNDIGIKRGIAIGAIDYLSSRLTGGIFKVSKLASKPMKFGAQFAERGLYDPAMEGFGELVAQKWSTGEIDEKEVEAEMLGGVGNNSVNAGMGVMFSALRNTNLDLANSLTNVSTVAQESASDERISNWASNMRRLGQIDAEVEQRIQRNVGLRREARDVLSVGENGKTAAKDSKLQARIMELMQARDEMSATTNRREVYRNQIAAVNEEIREIAETKKLRPAESQVNLQGINAPTAPKGVGVYKVNGTPMTKEKFLSTVSRMRGSRFNRSRIVVDNDPETEKLILKLKQDAIQKQSTAQVPTQSEATVGEGVGEQVPGEEVVAGEGQEVSTEETQGKIAETRSRLDELKSSIPAPVAVTPEIIQQVQSESLAPEQLDGVLSSLADAVISGEELAPEQQALVSANKARVDELVSLKSEQEALSSEVSDLETMLSQSGGFQFRAKEGVTTTRDANWDAKTKEELPASSFESDEAFQSTVRDGQWGMLTAENPDAKQVSDAENEAANKRAEEWLRSRGYNPQRIFGKYGNSENSFFVDGLTTEDAVEFAREFSQESVATDKGLVYQDGKMNPRKKGEETFAPADDFYSTIKIGDKLSDFSVSYDFDEKTESGVKPAPKTGPQFRAGEDAGISIVNGWYSTIEKNLRETKIEKQSANKWLSGGFIGKGDEAIYTGVKGWLESKNPQEQVSKQEILDWMKDNRVEIVEVVKGGDKSKKDLLEELGFTFSRTEDNRYKINIPEGADSSDYGFPSIVGDSYEQVAEMAVDLADIDLSGKQDAKYTQYQLEGEKENYKEVLVTLPSKELPEGYKVETVTLDNGDVVYRANGDGLSTPHKTYQEAENELKERAKDFYGTGKLGGAKFKSTHFDEPNILVHLRMNTRTDADGNKVLFLEEIQSDWGQEGKKEGFKISDAEQKARNYYPTGGVPQAPFVTDTNAWTKLGLKIALREAVAQGATKIAWTTGEQQNERYDLSEQLDSVEVSKDETGMYKILGKKDGETVASRFAETPQEMESFIGKELTDKIISSNIPSGGTKIFSGVDLKVGGKGMKGFYDKIVPDVAKALVKELTGKKVEVGETRIGTITKQKIDKSLQKELEKGNYTIYQEGDVWKLKTKGTLLRTPYRTEVVSKELLENWVKNQLSDGTTTQQSIDITPELKAQVQRGMPLFRAGENPLQDVESTAKALEGVEQESLPNIRSAIAGFSRDYVIIDNDRWTKKQIRDLIKEKIGEDVDGIVDIYITGSLVYGTSKENSDLDVVVEYSGDIREDDLFNSANDEPIEINGVRIDINPIKKEKSGTIADVIESEKKYLEGVADAKYISQAYHKAKADNSNPELVKAVEDLLGVTEDAEFEAILDEMNNLESPLVEFSAGTEVDTDVETDVDELNSRLDTPLETVSIEILDGVPVLLTISDQLVASNEGVTDPVTGNKISKLFGGLGFNGIKRFAKAAWANVNEDEAKAQHNKAKEIYKNNKEVIEKFWADNPKYDGHIPMVVVKMGERSIASNEAVSRVLVDRIKSLNPSANNKRKAFAILKEKNKIAIKKYKEEKAIVDEKNKNLKRGQNRFTVSASTKNPYKLAQFIAENNIKDFDRLLDSINQMPISARGVINTLLTSSSIRKPGKKQKRTSSPEEGTIAKALLGNNKNYSLLSIQSITDVLTEPSTDNVPIGNAISVVGVKIAEKQSDGTYKEAGGPVKVDHPNYGYGAEGMSFGVLKNPLPIQSIMPKAYNAIVSKNIGKVKGGQGTVSTSGALAIGMGMKGLQGGKVSRNPQKIMALISLINMSFPKVSVYTTAEAFNNIIAESGTRLQMKGDAILYGVTANGDIYINPDVHNSESDMFNTVIHEFGHVWLNMLATSEPGSKGRQLLERGISVLKEGIKTDPKLKAMFERQMEEFDGNEAAALNEMLAILIGNKGQQISDAATKSKFQEFLFAMWEYVRNKFKMSKDLSIEEIQDLSLDKFIETAIADMIQGEDMKISDKQLESMRSLTAMARAEDSMQSIIDLGRANGFSDQSIKEILLRRGFKAGDINTALEVKVDLMTNLPQSFTNVQGGVKEGMKMYADVRQQLSKYARKKVKEADGKERTRTMSEVRQKAIELLKDHPIFKAQAKIVQDELLIGFDQSLSTRANRSVDAQISQIKKGLAAKKMGIKELAAAQKKLIDFISDVLPQTSGFSPARIERLVRLVGSTDVNNFNAQAERVLNLIEKQKELMAKKEIEAALKAQRKEIKDMRAGRKQLAAAQKKLIDFISDVLPQTSGFSPARIERLVRLVGSTTIDNFESQAERVLNLIEKQKELMAKKEIEAALKAQRKEIRDMRTGRKQLLAAQIQLKNYIRKTLPKSSAFTQAQINRLISAITNTTLDNFSEQAQKVLDVVARQLTKMSKAKVKEISAIINKAAKISSTQSGKRRAGRVDADTQSLFATMKSVFRAITMEARDGDSSAIDRIMDSVDPAVLASKGIDLDVVQQKLDNGEELTSQERAAFNTTVALQELEVVRDFLTGVTSAGVSPSPWQHMEALNMLAQRLKEIASEGIVRLKADKLVLSNEISSLNQQATDQIKSGFGILYNEDGTLKGKNQLAAERRMIWENFRSLKIWEGIKGWVKTIDFQTVTGFHDFMRKKIYHLGTLSNILDKGGDFFKKNVYDALNRMDEATKRGYFNQILMLDGLARANGFKNYKDFTRSLSGPPVFIQVGTYKSPLNLDQILRLYALSKNDVQRKKLIEMGIDINEIEAALTDKQKAVADGVVDYLSNSYFDSVNNVYSYVNNVNLGYVSNYFPTKTIQTRIDGKVLESGDFGSTFNAETAPALKERTDTKGEIDIDGADFTSVLDAHFRSMEKYKAMAVGVRKITQIFKLQDVVTLLEQTGTKPMIMRTLNFAINPESMTREPSTFVGKLASKFTGFALAFKAIQILKQGSSFVQAFEDYTVRKGKPTPVLDHIMFMVDMAYIIATLPKQIKKAYNMSANVKDRLDQGLEGDVYGLESGTGLFRPISKSSSAWAKARRAFKTGAAAPTVLGDITGVLGYMAVYNRMIKQGFTQAEALEAFNNYNATQQSRRATEKSPIQMSNNEFQRLFTMFGSTVFLMMNKTAQTSTNIMRSISKGKMPKAKDVRGLMLNVAIANVLFVGAANIAKFIKGDEEDKEEALKAMRNAMLGLNLIYSIPLIGSAVETMVSYAEGDFRKADDTVNPFMSLFRKYQKSKQYLSEGEVWGATQPIIEIIIGAQLDPFIGIYNYFSTSDQKEEDAAMYDMLGITTSYRPDTEEKQQGGMNKEDMKRYFPDLYDDVYGPNSPGYDVREEIKEMDREIDKEMQAIKDEAYGK